MQIEEEERLLPSLKLRQPKKAEAKAEENQPSVHSLPITHHPSPMISEGEGIPKQVQEQTQYHYDGFSEWPTAKSERHH